jgi:hypothetical protein
MLLLSAASARDFVEAIVVICICGLNVVGRQSSEAHVKGSSLGDVAIDSRADDFTSMSNNFLRCSSNKTVIFAGIWHAFDFLSIHIYSGHGYALFSQHVSLIVLNDNIPTLSCTLTI